VLLPQQQNASEYQPAFDGANGIRITLKPFGQRVRAVSRTPTFTCTGAPMLVCILASFTKMPDAQVRRYYK
jgi:hypothetical protein